METPGDRPGSSVGNAVANFAQGLIATLLASVGGVVTAFFGLSVCLYVISRIGGGPRVPDLLGFFVAWLICGALPLTLGILFTKSPPGGCFFRRASLGVLLLFLVLGADAQFGPKNWHALFRPEKTARGDAAGFAGTYVTPHLETQIHPGTNVLYCGTFQLAWNEACALAGGDLQLADLDPQAPVQHPMAAALNHHAFDKDCIDPPSYVAMAGFMKDKIHEQIRQAVKDKFNGEFKPRLVPDKSLTPRPQDFVAYACLWKKLSFPIRFERLEDSFSFGGVAVRAFGMGRGEAAHDRMCSQVRILDYQNEDDFVIELTTTSPGDRLILAKVQPQVTIGNTIAAVRERLARSQPEPTGTNDVLIVPRISLDLTREYSEIEGHWLVPLGRKVARDLFLRSAMQSIKFEMNERGVELQSEAHMAFACAKQKEPPRKYIMVFNRPFLLCLKRTGAQTPYFALWVENPELLVRR